MLIETQLTDLKEQKKPINEAILNLRNKVQKILGINDLQVSKVEEEPKIPIKEKINIKYEDNNLLEVISQALEKKVERQLTDYFDGT